MIGWYVDCGVAKDRTTYNKLSDVNWLDRKRFVTIATDTSRFSEIHTGQTSLDSAYSSLVECVGNDVHTIYGVFNYPSSYDQNSYDAITSYIPSLKYSFPNTLSYINSLPNGSEPPTIVYHFKSLSRVIVYYGFLDGSKVPLFNGGKLYSVDSDGNFTSIHTAVANPLFRPATITSGAFYQGIVGYSDPSDLVNASKWRHVNFDTVVRDGQLRGWFDSSSGSPVPESFLTAFFGSGSKPDFTIVPPDNPYSPIDPSGPTDVPSGNFDNTSDKIPDSSLPTLSAANTGFTRIYNPSLSQVQELARYLWTDDTVLETIWNKIRQYFENPMDAIIGFNLVPVAVPNGGTKNFALMYIDTGVSMTAAASQFVDQDCGSVKLERFYGSALDQSPYTKVSCFLPYIGTVQLNTDEVMGATLQVKYRVDIVSGSCVAKIFVDGNVLYQYSGHCAINIPFSSADFSTYVSAAISVAKLAIGAATAGAAGLAASGSAEVGQQTNQVVTTTRTTTDTMRNPATGRQITTGTRSVVETIERPASESSTQASFAGLSPANISNTVGQIMASKPNVEHSGSFSGNTGYLGVRRPFLIIERPNMCLPENYQTLNGYPAMITMKLGDCVGYTRIQQIQLTGMTATNPEQAEILSLLKSGVIL